MGIIGCYSVDMYCDHPEHWTYSHSDVPYPVTYIGNSLASCLRQAKGDGWTVNKVGQSPKDMGAGITLCKHHRKRRTKK